MPFMTKEELHKTLDAAFAERLEGNELMKKGDNQGALRVFHSVLFKLKVRAIRSARAAAAPRLRFCPRTRADDALQAGTAHVHGAGIQRQSV